MAKIKTYKVVAPSVDDLIIGTTPEGQPSNDTKNFKIQDIVECINPYTLYEKTLSSSEIISMSQSTAYFVELIPNPGVGKYIEIESVVWKHNHNTTAFNFGNLPQLSLSYKDASTGLISSGLYEMPMTPAACFVKQLCANENVIWKLSVDSIWNTFDYAAVSNRNFGARMLFTNAATQGDGTWTFIMRAAIRNV